MKRIIVTVAIIAISVSVNSQNDKLDKVFNKIEKGVEKGAKEVKRISKEVAKELKPVIARIKKEAKPTVDRIIEDATNVYDKGEELAGNAVTRLAEAKKTLAHDVKEGIVSVDEKLRREERMEAVQRAIDNLNDSIKEEKEKVKKKAEEVFS